MKPAKHIHDRTDDQPIGRTIAGHDYREHHHDDPVPSPPPPLRVVDQAPTPQQTSGEAPKESYEPVRLRPRHDGWTAERQRKFLVALAETGSISVACTSAGVSSRSAYRLRSHPDGEGFALAWDAALKLATARLTALAYERATRGTVKETWVEGELKSTTRAPSDKLLMFLLQHLLPAGRPGDRWEGFETMATQARGGFPDQLAALVDQSIEMVPVTSRDFFGEEPGWQDEDV